METISFTDRFGEESEASVRKMVSGVSYHLESAIRNLAFMEGARVAATESHRRGGLNDRNLSHSSGGERSEIKALSGLVPSEGRKRRAAPGPSLVPTGALLAISGTPWLREACAFTVTCVVPEYVSFSVSQCLF